MKTPMHARDVDQHPRSTMPLAPLDALAMTIRCKLGTPIYTCGEPARFWYRIVTGAARQCVFSRRGYRHIVDFLRPGDLFGFDAQGTHQFSVEPIAASTTVARYPRNQAEQLVDCDPLVARRIRELAFDSALRAKRRAALIARATALERVSTFLLEMVDGHPGEACGVVLLPSRHDIADYLSLAMETVSRVLTGLRERGVIRFAAVRSVQICNRKALERARGLMGTPEVCAPHIGSPRHELQSCPHCHAPRSTQSFEAAPQNDRWRRYFNDNQ
jgi:CRP/FNR family nitrogen fixation transcriptional regulator